MSDFLVLLDADVRVVSAAGPPRGPHEFLDGLLNALEHAAPGAKVGADPERPSPPWFMGELRVSARGPKEACEAGREKFTDALEAQGMTVERLRAVAIPVAR